MKTFAWLRRFRLAAVVLLAGFSAGRLSAEELKFGGVEIGSSGVKMVALQMDTEKPDESAETLGQETINSQVMAGVDKTGMIDDEAISDTAAAVERLTKTLLETHGVAEDKISIVGSSGLLPAKNLADLVAAVKDKTGKTMALLYPEAEVRLTIKGSLEQEKWDRSTAIDVGGGNTKFGYMVRDKAGAFSAMAGSIPFGTKTFLTAVNADRGDTPLLEAIDAKRKEVIQPELQKEIEKIKLAEGERAVYLSGGLVWSMITLERPDTATRAIVKVSPDDFSNFNLRTGKEDPYEVALDGIGDDAVKAKAEKEIANVKKFFPPESLQAGNAILQELVLQLKLDDPGVEVYFLRDSQFAWIRGYVAEQNELEAAPTAAPTPAPTPMPEKAPTPAPAAAGDIAARLAAIEKQLKDQDANVKDIEKALDILFQGLKEKGPAPAGAGAGGDANGSLRKEIDDLKRQIQNLNKRLDGAPAAGPGAEFDPEASRKNFYAALTLYREGRVPESLKLLDLACQQNTGNVDAQYLKAIALVRMGQEKTALPLVRQLSNAIANDPQLYPQMCRALELVQGPARIRVEELLKETKVAAAVTP